MTRYQWTVVFAAWLGWGFDVFDGLLFNFVAPLCVPDLLGVPPGDPRVAAATGAITSLLLIGWATGGIVFGLVADRVGRARTLLLTMLLYAVATAACALATNVWTLAALRFIASLGIGGEWAAGASLVAEVVPERRRVMAGALLYTSAPVGIFFAGLVADVLTSRVPALVARPDLAWRAVFLAGLLPASIALWVRRRIREPEAWTRTRGERPRLRELFAPALRRATIGGFLMSLVSLITWWGTNAFLPFVVRHLVGDGATAAAVSGHVTWANTLFNVGGVAGTMGTVAVARLGRRALYALYLLAAATSIWVAFAGDWMPLARLRLLLPVGFAVYGLAGSFSFYLPELFPTRLRGTGAGFCFNTGRYFAAAGPFLIGRALGVTATPLEAIRWVAVVPLVGLLVVPFLVETAPRRKARDA